MKLYLISRNPGKIRELSQLAKAYQIELASIDIPKVEIQSESLTEIALYSVAIAYIITKKPVIVEDSGLYIKHLNMFPGALSSYVYKTIGISGILKLMNGIKDREAFFKSVIALAAPTLNGVKLFSGEVKGVISEEPRGFGGFGFDPIFIPNGHSRTFAEMSLEEKNTVSHRALAFKALSKWILENCESISCWSWM
ncbi:MAG: XTP/dITP diphosphatase [Sulfolobales archaeon]|nr:XTP/dITP diphosphatase [Sulfolobales archaeon]MDW8083320.1 XTP/dITP diphosphatase [Sulfolobales archaeon]